MIVRMFKDGLRVVPPVLIAPFEIIAANDKKQMPIKIEFDEDGLHFLTPWGMATLNEKNLQEGEAIETSSAVLP